MPPTHNGPTAQELAETARELRRLADRLREQLRQTDRQVQATRHRLRLWQWDRRPTSTDIW